MIIQNERPKRKIQHTTIRYNRRTKHFIVANSSTEITRIKATGYNDRQAKQLATLVILELDRPDLAEMVEATCADYRLHPESDQIRDRQIRAAFIVRDGLIDLNIPEYLGATVYGIVQSQSNIDMAYSVDEKPSGELICSCPDWHNGHLRTRLPNTARNYPKFGAPEIYAGQIECKHIAAYLMALRVKNQETL